MTDSLIAHLDGVRRQFESERGAFALFALLQRADSGECDLVVAAPWLDREKLRGLSQVVERVFPEGQSPSDSPITRIATLNGTDARLRELMAAFGQVSELVVLQRPLVPGLDITRAWVMRSSARPDEDQDVVVHYIRELNLVDRSERDRWLVFKGLQKVDEYPDQGKALALARRLARESGRAAWLLDAGGYPLKWISPNADAQPAADDVVMYYVDFSQPVPLRGWVVARGGQQEFVEKDDALAERRACQLATTYGVKCFRMRAAKFEAVNCGGS
jgi:hypothetical protein